VDAAAVSRIRTTVEGRLEPGVLAALARGVVLEDGPARVDQARRRRGAGTGLQGVELSLSEGRYREVKRLCRAVGLGVQRLGRVAFGALESGELPSGQWRELTPVEVERLAPSRPYRRRSSRAPAGRCGPGPGAPLGSGPRWPRWR
jgi:16S rRNA U516 pseudouridylate synthase RsuA-like enzyme